MQVHEYTHEIEVEVVGQYFVRLDRCHTDRQIIGSMMYLTNTRPDIYFVVNTLSQFLVEPRRVHLVAKHVMRYLKGTLDCGLSYDGDHNFRMSGYTDSYWDRSVSDRKSTSGCCFSLGSTMISW